MIYYLFSRRSPLRDSISCLRSGLGLASVPTLILFLAMALPLRAQNAAFKVDSSSVNLLQINTDAGMVARGILGYGSVPVSGSGVRLMWYPSKAAFRAGGVDGAQWDDADIGQYSAASS